MNKRLIGLLIFVGIAGVAFMVWNKSQLQQLPQPITAPKIDTTKAMEKTTQRMPEHSMHTVNYTNKGFEPKELTIKAGDMVTFKDNSSHELMTAFGEHASHDEYPDGEAHPTIGKGESETITFPKTGTFDYHNHHLEEDEGSIIVN